MALLSQLYANLMASTVGSWMPYLTAPTAMGLPTREADQGEPGDGAKGRRGAVYYISR